MIGRLTGFLAVAKSPSARSDNLIFAYGEVPRALDLSIRVTRLMSGVVRTLRVNAARMAEELDGGYTQATDLCEFIVQTGGVDYRSAYVVVGKTVRGQPPGSQARTSPARCSTRSPWRRPDGLGTDRARDLCSVLDPWQIVLTRTTQGGAAPQALQEMIALLAPRLTELADTVQHRREHYDRVEADLLRAAREAVDRG